MSAPRLYTARGQIRTVAERWREQYCHNGKWGTTFSGNAGIVYRRLSDLDVETATAEDVAAIIGNSGWTSIRCHGCDEYVDEAVEVGQEPDYESSTATLCRSCLAEAVGLMASARMTP